MTWRRTTPLIAEQYVLQELRPLPFISRRSAEPADDRRIRALTPAFFESGANYDTDENYFHRDPPASFYTAPFWMSSVDLLLHAYARQPLDGSVTVRPAVLRGKPPHVRPPYDKVIGLALDKIQVFSAAHSIESDAVTAELMNRPDFRGDVLLVAAEQGADPLDAGIRLEADERVAFDYEVLSFDANALRLKVTLPGQNREAWLLYCDAWHPDWTARVDGREEVVRRAFLAYKAVPIHAGINVVEFRMRSPARVWTFRLAAFNASLWVFGVIGLAVSCFRKEVRAGT